MCLNSDHFSLLHNAVNKICVDVNTPSKQEGKTAAFALFLTAPVKNLHFIYHL